MSHVPPGGPQQPFGPPGMPPANPYAPQGPPGSYAQPPAPSGGSYWWLYALGAVGLFFMCCCGGCFVLPFLITGPEVAAAYEAAASAVKNDPQVQAKLGTPLTTGIATQFQVNTKNDTGDATFKFTVTGPKGEGTVNTELSKSDGAWKPTVLRVKFDDNSSADLIP